MLTLYFFFLNILPNFAKKFDYKVLNLYVCVVNDHMDMQF